MSNLEQSAESDRGVTCEPKCHAWGIGCACSGARVYRHPGPQWPTHPANPWCSDDCPTWLDSSRACPCAPPVKAKPWEDWNRRFRFGRLSIYIEPRDIWVGCYVAPDAIYVCPLPLVVFRWTRVTLPEVGK